MRSDVAGFFWNDTPVPKPPKAEPPKREPPEKVWQRPGYLPPNWEEAAKFPVRYFTDHQLMSEVGGELMFDIECYKNFFQVAFMSYKTGYVLDYVMTPDDVYDRRHLAWLCENFTLISFNGVKYDVPMLSFAQAGYNTEQLKEISNLIIVHEESPWSLLKERKVKRLELDHIDLMEIPRIRGSLKAYSGRVHVPKLQDLPFHPEAWLTSNQMKVVRYYCVNDLTSTAFVRSVLDEQFALRTSLSAEHGQDLRSKSDAQIAEAILSKQIGAINKKRPEVPNIPPGTVFYYKPPAYMSFQSQYLKDVLQTIARTQFIVSFEGTVGLPDELKDLSIKIGDGVYRMGIGGLHSSEKKQATRATRGYRIFDVDVESFYPRMILNQGLYPKHLGPAFLDVYGNIVKRRVEAKAAKRKVESSSLKITINGTYGKLGSPYSVLYAPDLLIQTTLSGQLSLMMLIELFTMYGIRVVSANTDGIAVHVHETKLELFRSIVKYWEGVCSFKTEETEYIAMYNKDVNNYIAVKAPDKDGVIKTKTKGAYYNPWAIKDDPAERLVKNPQNLICVEAVEALLTKGVPVRTTVEGCRDISKFVTVRKVKGGAIKDGVYLGASLRWYYASGEEGCLIAANSGNMVPRSIGARPCMQLPAQFPSDIDTEWYVREADKILKEIAYYD